MASNFRWKTSESRGAGGTDKVEANVALEDIMRIAVEDALRKDKGLAKGLQHISKKHTDEKTAMESLGAILKNAISHRELIVKRVEMAVASGTVIDEYLELLLLAHELNQETKRLKTEASWDRKHFELYKHNYEKITGQAYVHKFPDWEACEDEKELVKPENVNSDGEQSDVGKNTIKTDTTKSAQAKENEEEITAPDSSVAPSTLPRTSDSNEEPTLRAALNSKFKKIRKLLGGKISGSE